jgi:hypothetical protein
MSIYQKNHAVKNKAVPNMKVYVHIEGTPNHAH